MVRLGYNESCNMKWHSINCQMTPLNNGAKILLMKFRKNYYHCSKLFSCSWYPKLRCREIPTGNNQLWILKLQFVFITFLIIYILFKVRIIKSYIPRHVFIQKLSFFSRRLTALNSTSSYYIYFIHLFCYDFIIGFLTTKG